MFIELFKIVKNGTYPEDEENVVCTHTEWYTAFKGKEDRVGAHTLEAGAGEVGGQPELPREILSQEAKKKGGKEREKRGKKF